MSIIINSSHVKNINYGSSSIIAVWEGSNLKFPNALFRKNEPVSLCSVKNSQFQYSFAYQQIWQSGGSSYLSAVRLPSGYDALTGFLCNISGYYRIRYKSTLYGSVSPGTLQNLNLIKLIKIGAGLYDEHLIMNTSPTYSINYGQTMNIDWISSAALDAGKYYSVCFDTIGITESNASVSMTYLG